MFSVDDLTARVTGNLPKAILCVRKYEAKNDVYVNGRNRLDVASISAVEKKAQQLMRRVSGSLLGAVDEIASGTDDYIEMEVQYNPSSITMDSQAGRQVQGSADNPNQLNIIQQPVATTMSFQLVFDDMNVADAFMINQGLTPGNIAGTVASTVNKLGIGASGYTVKDKMDGIMSLLMHSATRQVIFFWSRMCFQGELTSVKSQYTMFNKEGQPVRGVISLSIRQGEEARSAAVKFNRAYWQEKFDKVFGLAGYNMDFSDTSIDSMAGNVLNLWM